MLLTNYSSLICKRGLLPHLHINGDERGRVYDVKDCGLSVRLSSGTTEAVIPTTNTIPLARVCSATPAATVTLPSTPPEDPHPNPRCVCLINTRNRMGDMFGVVCVCVCRRGTSGWGGGVDTTYSSPSNQRGSPRISWVCNTTQRLRGDHLGNYQEQGRLQCRAAHFKGASAR